MRISHPTPECKNPHWAGFEGLVRQLAVNAASRRLAACHYACSFVAHSPKSFSRKAGLASDLPQSEP
jgi:hypothetical protein